MLWNLGFPFGPFSQTSNTSSGDGEEPYVKALAESYLRAHPNPDELNNGVMLYSPEDHDGPGGLDLNDHSDGWPQNGMRLLASSGEAPGQGSAPDPGQPQQPAQPGENAAPGDAGATKGTVPLPPHLQWANDPTMLSNHLDGFMKRNPLNPSTAPQNVKDIYNNMRPPSSNYGPPKGDAKDSVTFWTNYFGYPDQYGYNKVSVESKGNPNPPLPGSNAAGLEQVIPQTAEEMGFNFYNIIKPENNQGPGEKILDVDAWKTAMADPNFSSMLGSMVARKYYNLAGGDPFRAEAGYRNGFGDVRKSEREGKPWNNQDYIQKMFPGQWNGR